jgi:hypothetical protein
MIAATDRHAKIEELLETVAEQQLGKHVPESTDKQEAIKELLETAARQQLSKHVPE